MDGDVRLVPLNGIAPATATCDDVHFEAVELFRDGIWGRICDGQDGGDPEEFTLDAQVVCRQLGFPFGTVINGDDPFVDIDYRSDDPSSEPEAIIWATEVGHTHAYRQYLSCMPVSVRHLFTAARPAIMQLLSTWPGGILLHISSHQSSTC